jgi:hypothetical protein
MGCDAVWNPSYTATMVRHGLEAWDLEDIVLWQYCGDGKAAIDRLPHKVEGFGNKVDISVYVKGARVPTPARLAVTLCAWRRGNITAFGCTVVSITTRAQ